MGNGRGATRISRSPSRFRRRREVTIQHSSGTASRSRPRSGAQSSTSCSKLSRIRSGRCQRDSSSTTRSRPECAVRFCGFRQWRMASGTCSAVSTPPRGIKQQSHPCAAAICRAISTDSLVFPHPPAPQIVSRRQSSSTSRRSAISISRSRPNIRDAFAGSRRRREGGGTGVSAATAAAAVFRRLGAGEGAVATAAEAVAAGVPLRRCSSGTPNLSPVSDWRMRSASRYSRSAPAASPDRAISRTSDRWCSSTSGSRSARRRARGMPCSTRSRSRLDTATLTAPARVSRSAPWRR